MSSVVFLFGNGLSIGVSPAFAVPAMTHRLNANLDGSLRDALDELRAVATPDVVVPAETQFGFEQLAGPLDRVANAVQILRPFANNVDREDCLYQSHAYLRERYLGLVGVVLADVAASARLGSTQGWNDLNEMAFGLRALHAAHSTALFTLSYDTLLDSALIETQSGWFYDGFAGGTYLNQPLDRWLGTTSLYHLHGSVLWYDDPGEGVRKARSDSFIHQDLLGAGRPAMTRAGFRSSS